MSKGIITLTEQQFDNIVTIIAKKDRLHAVKIVHDVLEYSLLDAKCYVDLLLGI